MTTRVHTVDKPRTDLGDSSMQEAMLDEYVASDGSPVIGNRGGAL